jgi:hypothetical protein
MYRLARGLRRTRSLQQGGMHSREINDRLAILAA